MSFKRACLSAHVGAALDKTDELGTDFVAEAPHHTVLAFLGDIVAGQHQHKIIGNFNALDVKPHATRRNIGDETIPRQRAATDLNLRNPVDQATGRAALFF
jgi:hypothetical protein